MTSPIGEVNPGRRRHLRQMQGQSPQAPEEVTPPAFPDSKALKNAFLSLY